MSISVVKQFSGFLAALCLCLGLFTAGAAAQSTKSSPVSLDIDDTVLQLTGYAAPGSLVTITDGGSVIGTVVADVNGYYNISIGSFDPGLSTISLSYVDPDGTQSNPVDASVSVQAQQTTTVSTVLPPTLRVEPTGDIYSDEDVTLEGYAAAGSTVTVRLSDGSERAAVADANGYYSIDIAADTLAPATYIADAVTEVSGDTSEASAEIELLLLSRPVDIPDIVVADSGQADGIPPPVPTSPDSNSVIDGDTVTISGNSVANAQIVIYENGVQIGSVAADANGFWSFLYTATISPVTFTFEACIDGECSVLSQSVTLFFDGLPVGGCDLTFRLEQYRFWDVRPFDEVGLQIIELQPQDVIATIVWGDGQSDVFDYDSRESSRLIKRYGETGYYNGSITVTSSEQASRSNELCDEHTRYFSVHVGNPPAEIPAVRFVWLFSLLGIGFYIIPRKFALKK